MKNFRKVLIICILVLDGCAVSQKMWNEGSYQERFKSYFIDENDRVILIGENKTAYKRKDSYHYLVNDEGDGVKFNEAVKLGNNPMKIDLKTGPIRVKGDDVKPFWLWLGFSKSSLSSDQKIFLKNSVNCKESVDKFGCIYENINVTRYYSSKEMSKKSTPLLFLSLEKVDIGIQNTALQTTAKTIATPFTLAIDILLLPITIPYFLYHQVKESQTQHFCEGEFCGYENLKKK